jgi:hypothetical protein
MKKILLMLMLMVTFGSYSQIKKCSCCSKPTRTIHHIKKPKPKPRPVVKPVAKNTEIATHVTINYITDCAPIAPTTQAVKKDTVIKIVKVISEPIKLKPDTPEFEIYAGIVNPKHINPLGYMVGFNIMPNLHQIGKNGKEREYLNKFLFGFEFSGYKTNPQTVEVAGTTTAQVVTSEDCHCEATNLGGFTSGTNYSYNQDVKGLSLNFGVEIYKGWFLTGGVTAYKSKYFLNGNNVNTTNSVFIDAGVKKFFKVGNVFLSPMVKFNEQTSSFGLGFSYD